MAQFGSTLTRSCTGVLIVTLSLASAVTGRADTKLYERTLHSTGLVEVPQNGSVGFGTCWVVDRERRLVVTNQHVVGAATETLIYFPAFEKGEVIHEYDYYHKQVSAIRGAVLARDSKRDLALIQLDSLPAGIEALPLATKSAAVGEGVHSIGNSGVLDGILWRYTTGTVRMVYNAKIRKENGIFEGRIIETQAPINKGDSGGPLVNAAGEVVGVVVSYESETRLVSHNVDVSEVRAFLREAKSAEAKATPVSVKKVAELLGSWKVNLITPDGEQVPGECRYLPDGNFVLTFKINGGEKALEGKYSWTNGVLMMASSDFEIRSSVHWVKDNRFTFPNAGGMLIYDRQPAAVVAKVASK